MYLKEFDDAKVEVTKALTYHKNDQSFITLGKLHLLQGETSRAIDVYKQGVKWVLEPNYIIWNLDPMPLTNLA